MKPNAKLAIVIPAYKKAFLEQTIQSIADQSCQEFTLYIGDDASPYELDKIVKRYDSKLSIIYKQFDQNLGATDLVAHWNRCIDLVQDEEWIWFFSDDDLMDEHCVRLFYEYSEQHPTNTLLHFNIKIINEANADLYRIARFDDHLTTMDFFEGRLAGKLKSCAVEYIFRADQFRAVNRFEAFDLAWGADDATWVKLSVLDGIHTIDGAYVRWRQSSHNISPKSDRQTVLRKLMATINYIQWANRFFRDNGIHDVSTDLLKSSYPIRVIAYTSSLSFDEKYTLIRSVAKELNMSHLTVQLVVFWLFLELKETVKAAIHY